MVNFVFQGHRLREARKDAGLSQEELAEAVKVKGNSVSRWEIGESTPRKEVLAKISQVLSKPPRYFFDEDFDSEPVGAQSYSLPVPGTSTDRLLQAITSSDNPLDYDRALWDRSLEELEQVTPGALRGARDYLSLSMNDVAQLSGLSVKRLTDIELGQGVPPMPGEIMALRRALGVRFEPRAVAFSGLSLQPVKDKRSARVKLEESQRLWAEECQRVPNKLDTILAKLEQLQRDVDELKRGMQK